jgi:hypothetical protein
MTIHMFRSCIQVSPPINLKLHSKFLEFAFYINGGRNLYTKVSQKVKAILLYVLTTWSHSSYIYLIFIRNYPPFQCIWSNGPQVSDSVRIKCFRFGLKPFLHRYFPWLMLSLDAVSSVMILRLSRIRWSICSLTSTHVTADGSLRNAHH